MPSEKVQQVGWDFDNHFGRVNVFFITLELYTSGSRASSYDKHKTISHSYPDEI